MPDDAVKCAPDDAVKCAPDDAVICASDGAVIRAPDDIVICAPDDAFICAPDVAVKCADDGAVVDVDETVGREAVETPADLCEDLASLEAKAIGDGRAMFWIKGGSRLKSYFNFPMYILRYIWYTE